MAEPRISAANATLDLGLPPEPVFTCRQGENARTFAEILGLYVEPGETIADVTHGKGAFWSEVPPGRYEVRATDLMTGTDFRNLPYPDATLNALVLDPPYMSGGSGVKESLNGCYRNAEETRSPQATFRLYLAGILEAARCLRKGGILILKCQDAVESHVQWLVHHDLLTALPLIGFRIEDLFVLHQKSQPIMRHRRQEHARKNHSYFIVGRLVR
jgi:hypothetical protein